MRGKITADEECQQALKKKNMKIPCGGSSWLSRMAEATLRVLEGDVNKKPAISFAEAWHLRISKE